VVRQVAPPPSALALSTLARVDYADAFLLETGPGDGRTGEQWARAILEDAPVGIRRSLSQGWCALGRKLGCTDCDRFVLGWEVRHSSPDYALLGAGSRLGMPAELLFEPQEHGLLFATFVHHGNPLVRGVWAGTKPVHQQVVRRVLERAESAHL
jgi:hypothetical protein